MEIEGKNEIEESSHDSLREINPVHTKNTPLKKSPPTLRKEQSLDEHMVKCWKCFSLHAMGQKFVNPAHSIAVNVMCAQLVHEAGADVYERSELTYKTMSEIMREIGKFKEEESKRRASKWF